MALTGLFAGIKTYETAWEKVNEQPLNQGNDFSKGEVVMGDYGLSAKLTLSDGSGIIYIPMDSKNAWSNEGDILDLDKCTVIVLRKEGYDDILRVIG